MRNENRRSTPRLSADRLAALARQVHGERADAYLGYLYAAHPRPSAERAQAWLTTLEHQATSGLPRAVIFDLDGTLLDNREAKSHLHGPGRSIDAYHDACATAPVMPAVLAVHRACREHGLTPLVVTSRMERNRQRSARWLAANEVEHQGLYMRSDGDARDDYVVKGALYQQAQQDFAVVHALDDNPLVLRLWADLGIAATTVPNLSYEGAVEIEGLVEVDNFLAADPALVPVPA